MSGKRFSRLIPFAAGLGLALACGAAQAYEYTQQQYDRMGRMFPPYDHEGHMPENDSRRMELNKIRDEIRDRQHRLEVTAFTINLMDSIYKDPVRTASLRRDYENRLINHTRWKESVERRRQAILEMIGTSPATTTATVVIP